MARRSIHAGRVAAHTHPQLGQITFWTNGGGVYRIEDRVWQFTSPAVSFIPSNVVHGFEVTSGSDATVLSVAIESLHQLTARLPFNFDSPIFCTGPGDEVAWRRLATTMRQIATEFSDRLEGSGPALQALLSIALVNIGRLHAVAARPALPAILDLANRLERLIEAHFRDRLTVGAYAQRLGTTSHLLDRAAREVHGASVKELIGRRMFLEAKRLLQFTIRPVEDIGFELSFKDPAYFSRWFRKWSGKPPGAWRAERLAESAPRASN